MIELIQIKDNRNLTKLRKSYEELFELEEKVKFEEVMASLEKWEIDIYQLIDSNNPKEWLSYLIINRYEFWELISYLFTPKEKQWMWYWQKILELFLELKWNKTLILECHDELVWFYKKSLFNLIYTEHIVPCYNKQWNLTDERIRFNLMSNKEKIELEWTIKEISEEIINDY